MVTSRVFVLILVMALIVAVIVHRLFDLQIVHGEEYLDSFRQDHEGENHTGKPGMYL